MRRSVVPAALLLSLWFSVWGCSDKGEPKTPDSKITARPPVAVEVTNVAVTDFTEGLDVVGSLSPKFVADVKSEYAGIVTEVYVTEWVKVSKGTPLARIDTREMEVIFQKAGATAETARANLLQAEVAASRANREYDRLLKLKEYGLITQQSLDEGLSEKEAAAARIASAAAQLKVAAEEVKYTQTRLSKTTIRSPINGVVSFRGVNVGEMVGEMGSQRAMFKIIDTRILDLTVTIPSSEMGRVRVGLPLTFSTDALPGRNFTGKVMFVNPVVNEADRSVKVVVEVENASEQLKGGLYVKGRIITGKRTGILQVPRVALLSWDVAEKKGDLFVVKGDIVNRRAVRTGSVMGDFVEVTSGVAPGDPVVVRGGFNLKEGDRVDVSLTHGG